MREWVVATTNPEKLREYRELLVAFDVRMKRLPAGLSAPAETGATYLANAEQKARAYSAKLPGETILADDSGLELAACPDWLGVRTARDLAAWPTADAKNQAILTALNEKPRDFVFTAALVLARGGQVMSTATATLTGTIAPAASGNYSAGLDRILIPDGATETLAAMPFAERRAYLPRFQALKQLVGGREDEI